MSKRELDKNSYPSNPFENIALGLSGGGFRSASYCLGLLSYLNKIKLDEKSNTSLLNQVKYISTTSGGTITGAFYAFCNHKNLDFDIFYKKLYKFLEGEVLLDRVLSILTDDNKWKGDKRRNIINSFAKAYDSEELFNGELFDVFWDKKTTHIEEVCFNTTEFYSGLPFRFQANGLTNLHSQISTGNDFVSVEESPEAIINFKKIKIADIVAASSCFPAGFEPMIYPSDFSHSLLSEVDLKETLNINGQNDDVEEIKFIQRKTIGLMDGGITDNQGLFSLMDADKKRQEADQQTSNGNKRFDLIIVNDVASHFMEHYVEPEKKAIRFWGKMTLRKIKLLFNLFLINFIVVNFIGIILYISTSTRVSLLLFIAIILQIILSLIISSFLSSFKKLIIGKRRKSSDGSDNITFNKKENFTKKTTSKLYMYFRNVDIVSINQMLFSRINSVLTLNNDVFLKHIRRLIYNRFYSDPCWHYRRISNHVYELSYTNTKNRIGRWIQKRNPEDELISLDDFNVLSSNDDIKRVAQNAFKTPTTLWFDEARRSNYVRESLIACGQFTTCHNLLKYIMRLQSDNHQLYKSLDKKYQERVEYIKGKLLTDWQHFLDDPFWLLNMKGESIEGYLHIDASMIKYPTNE